jgi:hypothetical protein
MMKVTSTVRTGFREGGGEPLLEVGTYDLTERLGRKPTPNERAYIDALAEAKLVTIEDDAPEPPKSGPRAIEDRPKVRKRTTRPAASKPASPVLPVESKTPRKRVRRS